MPAQRWGFAHRLLAAAVGIVALISAASLPPTASLFFAIAVLLAFAIISARRPDVALSVLAIGIPTFTTVGGTFDARFGWTPLLVLSLIGGAGIARATRGILRSKSSAMPPLALLGVTVAASLTLALLSTDLAFARGAEIAGRAWSFIVNEHLYLRSRYWPLEIASPLLQGVALFWIGNAMTGPQRHRIVRFLVIGGAVAAAVNVWNAAEVVLQAAEPRSAIWHVLTEARFSVPLRDVNAAGSYFTIALFAGIAAARGTGLANRIWIAAAVLSAAGVWLSGSRAAIGASGAVLGMVVLRTALAPSSARRERLVAIGLVAVCAVCGLFVLNAMPEKFEGRSPSIAMEIRAGMGAAALKATATRPVFGIGVGEFYNRSPEFMSREMLAIYPRENAHNNYLQILAELGIVGLAAFLWLLHASLAPRRGDLKAFWTEGKWNGLHIGLFVFLVTCLSGHPLLVPEVAYVFWIALGLAAADRQEAIGTAGSSRRARIVAGALCAFVLVTLPIRVTIARQSKNLQDVVFGVSHWRRDAEGVLYRRLATDATFFIPASGTFVDIPLRLSEPYPEPVSVAISFDDVVADRVVLERTGWRRVHLLLPKSTNGKWIRVRLRIEPATAPTVLLGTLDER